jgi:hypothetical protein
MAKTKAKAILASNTVNMVKKKSLRKKVSYKIDEATQRKANEGIKKALADLGLRFSTEEPSATGNRSLKHNSKISYLKNLKGK